MRVNLPQFVSMNVCGNECMNGHVGPQDIKRKNENEK